MARMSGGEALVRALEAEGVELLFGLPGNQILSIYDALINSTIRHLVVRHELSSAYMADGYARVTGRVGVALTISGPGAANTLSAMQEAYNASSPILLITGQVDSHLIGKGKWALHDAKDQLMIFSGVTGWNGRVERVEEIPAAIHDALATIRNGRPCPAHLELPRDILSQKEEVEIGRARPVKRRRAEAEKIGEAARLLKESKRPCIYAGGGVISAGAWEELRELAERIQAPVFTSIKGKGALPDDHPLAIGHRGADAIAQEFLLKCDCLLVVGTRFDFIATDAWALKLPSPLIQIDIDEREIGNNYPATLGLVGEAKGVLRELLKQLEGEVRPSRSREVARLKERLDEEGRSRNRSVMRLLEAIRSAIGEDTITVWDVTIPAYWALKYFPVTRPKSFLFPTGSGGMGFALPAALGAKAALPDRGVVAVCGDGSFLATCQELATAMRYGLGITILIFNNNSYGAIKERQEKLFGRSVDVELFNPDLLKLAEAFGARGIRLKSARELKGALKEALASGRLTLLELPISLASPYG